MSDNTKTILQVGGALVATALLGYGVKHFFESSKRKEQREHYFVGIDLGATNAKAGVVNDEGELLATASQPLTDYTDKGVVSSLVEVATKAVTDAGLKWSDISEIGVGSPGTIDFDVTFFHLFHLEWCCDQGLQFPNVGSRSARSPHHKGDWSGCTTGSKP